LHQVCKCQFAASLIEQLAASLMSASMLMQVKKIRFAAVVICRLDASCFINLHQVCGHQVLTNLIEQLADERIYVDAS
jgi:hypothetical protein